MFRWSDVEADHVEQLLIETRIVAELDGLCTKRLQTIGFRDPLHQCRIGTELTSQRMRRPPGNSGRRLLLGGLADDLLDQFQVFNWRPSTSRGIPLDAGDPALCEPPSPQPDGGPSDTDSHRHLLILDTPPRLSVRSSPAPPGAPKPNGHVTIAQASSVPRPTAQRKRLCA